MSAKRWRLMMEQARSLVDVVHTEMETYLAKRSDEWQESERGEAFVETMECVEEAAQILKEVVL